MVLPWEIRRQKWTIFLGLNLRVLGHASQNLIRNCKVYANFFCFVAIPGFVLGMQ